MSHMPTELVEISRLNGDFKKNYGRMLGAFLYLRSIGAARGRPFLSTGILIAAVSVGLAWLRKHGFN